MSASHGSGAEALDGGILAAGGPADVRRAVAYIDQEVPPSHPFYGTSLMFKATLLSKVRALGWPDAIASFHDLLEQVVAPHYGVTLDEIYERSSAVNHLASTRVPVLVLHGEDDEVVPVEHARMLEAATADSDLVRVWVVPGGGHAAFDVVDRDWTYAVYRTFFERLATYEVAARTAAAA
jgi:pimeloyl-ACP methyl ester carboxylesterase